MKNALYAKFNNVMTRPGRGGSYPYIRWQDVADRMNQVFGVNWSSTVEEREIIEGNVIIRVNVSVFDPETKRSHCQEGYGGAPFDSRNEAGNPFKAAYSKAFKDACKKWGVGLYIDEEGEEPAHTQSTMPPGYMGKEYGVPPTAQPAPAPAPEPIPEPVAVSAPVATGGMPMPPGVSMEPAVTTTTIVQEATSPAAVDPSPSFKTVPTPTAPPATPVPPTPPTPPQFSSREEMPMSKVAPIRTGGPDYISDVQKAALHSILDKSGMEYEALVKEAFEFNGIVKNPIPEVDKLTYDDAVKVVKYGNDKFRSR